ncbi:uncharacterized protein (TIGR02453 family) [Aequitasia blattaphilus]|uniref:DUF2461 domain-containing protein n=1 Tax=Aequitasia blattaphilus TaxID=2949332 RepID=A0ABT1EC23_9FIRM|nr:DUF2461 domain-containing protein [Aequitasia blattaphilus]MCP1103194.1 DUF2461 domain-containing protein [Aequitasia blattaphilus]MCR8615834.1 DUF2461 domain-containing protein [Aequitasia blattaphilus]
MDTNIILKYLSELDKNNNRDWFHEHKDQRLVAQKEFEELIQALIFEIGKFDASILLHNPKDLTFKMVRDTRFSHDKTPYNPAFRCHISSKGKLPVPVGYFLMIKPGNQSFLGGGLFADMFKDATALIRDYIYENSAEFLSIIEHPLFAENFKVSGTSLKNVPKEFSTECPAAEYLKYKSWYIEYPIDDTALCDASSFVDFASEKFLQMRPFNDFLNKALEGFVMPTR